MSSSSSFVPQHRPHVSVMLSSFLAVEKEQTRKWLRDEMDRLVEPMLDSIFSKLETKLLYTDWARYQSDDRVDGDDCALVVNPVDQVETSYTNEIQQPASLICQPSTSVISCFNHHSHPQQRSIDIEPEYGSEILTQVKREIEKENVMALKNMMDTTPQSNQQFGQQIENCGLNRIRPEDSEGCHVQVPNQFEHVQSPNPQPSTLSFNQNSLQLDSFDDDEEEIDPEILAEVKREIEEENEMALKNIMDTTPQSNQLFGQQIEDCGFDRIRSEDGDGDRVKVVNQIQHVESSNLQSPSSLQLDSFDEEEIDPEILAEVKREIEEENELKLKKWKEKNGNGETEDEVIELDGDDEVMWC